MKYNEMLAIVGEAEVFTTASLLAGQPSPRDIRRQLDRWLKAGKIVMLRRGVYAVSAPFARRRPHPFVVANALRTASYVSLQSALAYYGMIPEHTPVTTSITTGRPESLSNPMGRFVFQHVKKPLFSGFAEREIEPGQRALMATPEKALVDLLYLTPGSDTPAYLEELRVTPVPHLDGERLAETAKRCGSKKVIRAISRIQALWKAEKEFVAL